MARWPLWVEAQCGASFPAAGAECEQRMLGIPKAHVGDGPWEFFVFFFFYFSRPCDSN